MIAIERKQPWTPMQQWRQHTMKSMTSRDLAQWRHLVLKLRWIGLEHEARRLQSIVGSMHLKAELARQPEPPIPIEIGGGRIAGRNLH
jgi:hypothetical protein